MNPFRRIILATTLLIAGVSVAAFSQEAKPKNPKKPAGEKVQSEKENHDQSFGLKKLTLRSEDARDWEDWQDVDFDFDFDFEEIGTMISESIEASLKSIDIRFESLAVPIGPIHMDIDPIEPIDIDIEPIEPIDLDIEPIDIDLDMDIDIDMDEDMDIDMGPGHGKHKDKHKEDKDKVKTKDKDEDKKQDKEKEKDKDEKSKGLKKIKGN